MIDTQIWPLIKFCCSDETFITCHCIMLWTTYANNSSKNLWPDEGNKNTWGCI